MRLRALTLAVLVFYSCSRENSSPAAPEVVGAPPRSVPTSYAVATESRVRVRREPTLESEPIGHLYENDLIEIRAASAVSEIIDGVAAPWYGIRTVAGLSGWAFGAFVTILDESEYESRRRQLSVSTINIPWEIGEASETDLRDRDWSTNSGEWNIDFFPEGATSLQGNPLTLHHSGGGTPIIGRWRIRGGYLITEIDGTDNPFRDFAIWQISEQGPASDASSPGLTLSPLYRTDVPVLAHTNAATINDDNDGRPE